jgi:urea transporter
MAVDDLHTDTSPSMTSLVSGIITDAQQLIRQEVALAKREIQQELNKAKLAAVSFGIGIMVSALGGAMLCIMIALLIGEALNHYWAGFGIFGGVLVCVGGALFFMAKSKVQAMSMMPQTVETMKENVQWIKNQT